MPEPAPDDKDPVRLDAPPVFMNGSPRVYVDRIDWLRVIPLLHLLRAPALALQPAKLLVAFGMLVVILIWGAALDGVWRVFDGGAPFVLIVTDVLVALSQLQASVLNWVGLSATSPELNLLGALTELVSMPLGWWSNDYPGVSLMPLFVLLWGFGATLAKALGVAMLSLLAGSEACLSEPIALGRAWRGALIQAPRLLLAWISIGVAALLLLLPGWVVGLLFRLPVLDLVGGLLYLPLLVMALVAAVLLIAHGLAVHVMPMAVAIDDDDLFDTVSRSINYSVVHPLKFIGCQLVGLVILAITGAVVFGLFNTAQSLALAVLESSAGESAQPISQAYQWHLLGLGSLSEQDRWPVTLLVSLGLMVVYLVVWSIIVSTYSCLQARIYLILRRSLDGADHHEIHGPAAPRTGMPGSQRVTQ